VHAIIILIMCANFFNFLWYTGWTVLDKHFSTLCDCLLESALVKLKSASQLSNEDHQQLVTMISSSCESQQVKEKIVTFLIVKLCYNGSSDSLTRLVMDTLIESGEATGDVRARQGSW